MLSDDDSDGSLPYRQKDVLALLARGLTAAESARVLDISASTVEHERVALRRVLDAKTPPHLVAIAYETRLLPLTTSRRERLEALIRLRLL